MPKERETFREEAMPGGMLERLRAASRRFLLATIGAIGALCGGAAFVFHALVRALDALLVRCALASAGPLRPILVVGTTALAFFAIAS